MRALTGDDPLWERIDAEPDSPERMTLALAIWHFVKALMNENGRWVLGNSTKKFFKQKDFAEWYSCPGGVVTRGSEFSDPSNWGGANCLRPGKTKWFFVGVDDNGKRVKGEAVVEQLAELIE